MGRRDTCGRLTFAGDWTLRERCKLLYVQGYTTIVGSIGEATPGLAVKVIDLEGGQKLTIAGNCTYTGQTYIKAYSQLTVNGDITSSSDVLVRKGSTLSGYGALPLIHARQSSASPVWVSRGVKRRIRTFRRGCRRRRAS